MEEKEEEKEEEEEQVEEEDLLEEVGEHCVGGLRGEDGVLEQDEQCAHLHTCIKGTNRGV